MLPGISGAGNAFPGVAPSTPIDLTYVAHGKSASYSNFAIGTAAANRRVIVALNTIRLSSQSSTTHTGVTVAGAACTKLAEAASSSASAGGSASRVSLWITTAPLVSGTTGTINFSAGTITFSSIMTWAAYGVGSVTPFDAKTATGLAALSASINCPENGALISAACLNAASSATLAWTGINEDIDADNNATKFGGASQAYLVAETGRAISVTPSATTLYSGALVAATLSPA